MDIGDSKNTCTFVELPSDSLKSKQWKKGMDRKWRCKLCKEHQVNVMIVGCFKGPNRKDWGGHCDLCIDCAKILYKSKPKGSVKCFNSKCSKMVTWINPIYY